MLCPNNNSYRRKVFISFQKSVTDGKTERGWTDAKTISPLKSFDAGIIILLVKVDISIWLTYPDEIP